MKRLWLVRHGQTDWNVDMRLQGSADIPLNDVGRRQADEAARALAGLLDKPASVVSSPLARARDTAQQIASAVGTEMVDDARLAERSFGVWEGTTESQRLADNESEVTRWHGGLEPRIEGYETHRELRARMREAIDEHAAQAQGDLVVVSHGSAMRAAMTDMLGIESTPTQARSTLGGLDNAHWAVLVPIDDGWSLVEHNVGPQ